MKLIESLERICETDSKVLILGTAPGKKSINNKCYYSDPGNRIWDVIENVYGCAGEPLRSLDYQKKIDYLKKHHIALGDVIKSCYRKGSSDSSITNVEFTDIKAIIDDSNIDTIVCNGRAAYYWLQKYKESIPGGTLPGVNDEYAPSTSARNSWWNRKKNGISYSVGYYEKWEAIKKP